MEDEAFFYEQPCAIASMISAGKCRGEKFINTIRDCVADKLLILKHLDYRMISLDNKKIAAWGVNTNVSAFVLKQYHSGQVGRLFFRRIG